MRWFLLIPLLTVIGCAKQTIKTSDVIYGLTLSPSSVDADGTSIISVSVMINKDADAADRKITFETSSGTFTANGTKTITVDAVYEEAKLVASTVLKAPASPGTVVVSAKPAQTNPYNDFVVKDSVKANASLPATIRLESSAFSVSTSFVGEVQLTGTLRNDRHKNVSVGNTVVFEDYLVDGTPLNGRFRSLQVSSNDNSQVSAVYSPGNIDPGTDFYIRCTVLNNGTPTMIKDSVLLTVIP